MKVFFIILFSLIFLLLLFLYFAVGLYVILDSLTNYRSRKSLKEHDND